jgi:pimeloyl-ACP methyl ester carboxylesterase
MKLWTLPAFTAIFALSGCVSAISYGDVPHSQLSAAPQCNPLASDVIEVADKPFFAVTSRRPDCRRSIIDLTSFRSEQMRYARFATPNNILIAKGKTRKITPIAFQDESRWWAGLADATNAHKGQVLLYVHGFRETFDTTSADAAQIARLTGFDGPVVAYLWPSQGELLSYAVDETNMYWDENNFRRFLSKLAGQPWVKDVVIVSHSLGARLVLPSIEYVDRNSSNADASNISNIILASPDIDRQDFERDIAEEVLSARRVNNDRRITVYTSASDKALTVSRTIHGYPRLGSPYCFDPFERLALKAKGLPERCYASKSKYDVTPQKSGLTIIDTTDASSGGSGHSDYLKSAAACTDFAAVVNGAIDRKEGRLPTHLSHVFRLQGLKKGEKIDSAEICKRL